MACTWWLINTAAGVKPRTFQIPVCLAHLVTFRQLLPPTPPQHKSSPPSKAACKKSEGPGRRHFWDHWRTLEMTVAATVQFAPLDPVGLWAASPPLPPSALWAAGYCRCNRSWSCPWLPLVSWRRREGWWSWSTSSLLWPPRGLATHLGSPHSHTRGLSLTA